MNLIKKYFAVLTGLFSFIIYLATLAPSVIQIDSGELSAVQATLGIAHPTGYPLFTLTGYLFSLIPLGLNKAFQLNLLAAVWCSLGTAVFTYTAKVMLDNIKKFSSPPTRQEQIKVHTKRKGKVKISDQNKISVTNEPAEKADKSRETKKYLAAISAGLILAFSRTYWFQSTSVEVYSLQVFIFCLLILSLVKAFLYEGNASDFKIKNPWLWFAFFLALGFSNHMTTLLILPGTAYLYFLKYRFSKRSFKSILPMLGIFFPVLIILYLYLPIRASQSPVINWGNPLDLERFIRHITGKQYQVWLFSSGAAAKKQLGYFFSSLFSEFNVSLFIAIAGLVAAFFESRRVFLFLGICFLTTVLYSINYDINDIDSYFLLAYVSISFFALFGVMKLSSFLKMGRNIYLISVLIIELFIIVQIYINFSKVNQSYTYDFEDYTKALLKSTTKNSVIFSYQWDYFISPSYYLQNVENFRKDAVIIDKELLRRSWYYNQIRNSYPDAIKGIEPEIKLFLTALEPFERGENYNSSVLENLYRRIMTNLISTNTGKRDFYIGPELFENEIQAGQFTLPAGYTLVPDIFLFKVVKGNGYVPAKDPDYIIRFTENRNHYTEFIKRMVGAMLVRRALYEMQFDRIERARVYIRKIKKEFPNYILPQGLSEVVEK
ncbi:MAG: protein O-mannosyl-transferase family [Ignavibacteria bacterium]